MADGSFLMCSFAEALGRVLLDGAIWTLWVSKHQVFGAVLAELGGPAIPVSSEEARRVIALPTDGEPDELEFGSLTITWTRKTDGTEGIRISSRSPRTLALWLFRPAVDADSAEWIWYRKYLPGLKNHFVTVRALLQTRATAEATLRRTRYEAAVKHLAHERVKDFARRMDEMRSTLEEVTEEDEIDCLDLTEEIAVIALQELMGTGWAVRQVGRIHGDRPSYSGRGSSPGEPRPESRQLDLFRSQLEAKLDEENRRGNPSVYTSRDRERKARILRLTEMARCFRALLDDEDLTQPPEAVRGEEALSLLPVWTRVHEACRLLCRPRPAAAQEYAYASKVWGPAVQLTFALLTRHLELHPALPGGENAPESVRRGSSSARNWLALWFSLEVLRSLGIKAELSTREGCALYADLAYVLREGLRYACFGQRRDYFFSHPPTLPRSAGWWSTTRTRSWACRATTTLSACLTRSASKTDSTVTFPQNTSNTFSKCTLRGTFFWRQKSMFPTPHRAPRRSRRFMGTQWRPRLHRARRRWTKNARAAFCRRIRSPRCFTTWATFCFQKTRCPMTALIGMIRRSPRASKKWKNA
ncbi:MAG: hypothetical protein IPK82_28275 [Polyangiaceae bacterium]|nr:hypothetical protein [Polyangiaceae bacterium]